MIRLPIADLRAGTNTLTVALIDVGGVRRVKTVTFAARRPATAARRRRACGCPRAGIRDRAPGRRAGPQPACSIVGRPLRRWHKQPTTQGAVRIECAAAGRSPAGAMT